MIARRKNVGGVVPDARRLTVGIGKAYSSIDAALAALSAITWQDSAAGTGTVGVTAGSAAVTGSGTSFLSEVRANDYIVVGANTEPVKSVESDTALTLWSGSRATAAGSAFTVRRPDPYEIKLYGAHQITQAAILPIGIDLRIVGAPGTAAELLSTASPSQDINILLATGFCGRVAITDLLLSGDNTSTDTILAGAFGSGRGICEMRRLRQEYVSAMYANWAAVTMQDMTCINARWSPGADYLLVEDVSNHTLSAPNQPNDQLLMYSPFPTDTGHSVEINRFVVQNDGVTAPGQNGGWEYNGVPAGKVVNVRNSRLVQTNTPSGGGGLWWPVNGGGQGTHNFYDCIIHSELMDYDINNHQEGMDINLHRCTRLDGSAVRLRYAAA